MPTTELGRARLLVVAVVVLVLGTGGALLWWTGVGPLPDPEGCRARVGGVTAELSTEQARERRADRRDRRTPGPAGPRGVDRAGHRLPGEQADATSSGGDRDSAGLFQQRPSQGWGTRRQVQDPTYATNAFYDALVKVDGYQDLRITEAAQAVQRSGFPEAYEEHAPGARALASALTGYSPAPVLLRGGHRRPRRSRRRPPPG